MKDLIYKVENNVGYLDKLMSTRIIELDAQIEALTNKRDNMRKELRDVMLEHGITDINLDDKLIFHLVPEGDVETFDKKKFRSENPDLYDKYAGFRKREAYITARKK